MLLVFTELCLCMFIVKVFKGQVILLGRPWPFNNWTCSDDLYKELFQYSDGYCSLFFFPILICQSLSLLLLFHALFKLTINPFFVNLFLFFFCFIDTLTMAFNDCRKFFNFFDIFQVNYAHLNSSYSLRTDRLKVRASKTRHPVNKLRLMSKSFKKN